jgi:hypothetical protein
MSEQKTTVGLAKMNRKKRIDVGAINDLLNKPFLNECEVSALTGRALSTLRNDRFYRRGINYLKVGGRSIRYRTPDVINFMEARPITFHDETAHEPDGLKCPEQGNLITRSECLDYSGDHNDVCSGCEIGKSTKSTLLS